MIGPATGPWGFLDFAEEIADLVIPGVVRDYGLTPPGSLSTADLPAKYIGTVVGNRTPFVFCQGEGSGMMTITLTIAIEPIVQNLPEQNRIDTLTMMDSARIAIMEGDMALSRVVNLDIRQDVATDMAGIHYWAVVAAITARG